jgi:hypothetical protein
VIEVARFRTGEAIADLPTTDGKDATAVSLGKRGGESSRQSAEQEGKD